METREKMAKYLTEEDFLNAKSYVELPVKEAEARLYAQYCIDKVAISVGKTENDKEVLPPMFQENPMMKSMFGLQFLLYHYFEKLLPDENGEIFITAEEYDEWGKGSMLNTIERFKMSKNIEVRNKAFDIATDYREFYRMLGTEIASALSTKNDLLSRLVEFFKASISPETFSSVMNGLKDIQKDIDEYQSTQKEWKKPNLVGEENGR
jgi:hypothetical protein